MDEMRLIDADALKYALSRLEATGGHKYYRQGMDDVLQKFMPKFIDEQPAVDAAPVVHGRWERCGGDLHSSGYAVSCSACNKTHFVHYESSLGGLFGCKELFKEPKYCPNCGAKMDGA